MQSVIKALEKNDYSKETLSAALQLEGLAQKQLFQLAQNKRDSHFPSQEVEIRSVIEISNVCLQKCNFCNIHASPKRNQYTLSAQDFSEITEHLYSRGRRVILVQSGENTGQNFIDLVSKCLMAATRKYPDISFILCLGNLDYDQYKQLKDSGAQRYILKFETSNPAVYRLNKPKDDLKIRLDCLNKIIDLGFEAGSGNIVGLPGQSLDDLVSDLLLISSFELTMASSSVFVPGENSAYKDMPYGDINTTLNFMSLIRLMNPDLIIPSTSSLEKAKTGGQFRGILAGANSLTIHDGTPQNLKQSFPIYSLKRFIPDENYINDMLDKANLRPAQKITCHSN
ncbi:MAG: radical SAM protein [Candidatus Omnitrophica bacterium]|nr:radical SAM protein [Candidatus Omnitrophota bacterium]